MKELLFPVGWIYQGVTGIRNWLYDKAWRKSQKVDARVIAIGNLTVGGTGKTPTALAMVELLQKRGKKCAVISRGYKREQKGVLEVTTEPQAANIFGDEPALIKAAFPEIPVVVGERRVQAAQAVLAKEHVDVLVADDAYQHRSLHRDLNILLFDVTENLKNYRILPVGLARESVLPALRRADILVLTKANLVSNQELEERREWLKAKIDRPIIEAEYIYKGVRNLDGERVETLKDAALLVTGVAKPDAVELTVANKIKLVKHRKFADHHRYTDLEVETFLDEASQLQARWIVTTGKDAIKLGSFPRLKNRLWVIELGVEFKGDTQALYEAIDRVSRPDA